MMGNRGSSALPSPDISSGNEVTADDKERSGTLLNLDLLHCPVCVEPFTTPIFQCDNGHLACSSCCTKLRNKCPNCTLPIGIIRSRAMENIIESITVPCQNSCFGCTEIFSFKDQKNHEKECFFSPCSCPLLECNYRGDYKDLYHHFDSTHGGIDRVYSPYVFGRSVDVWMHLSDKIYVLKVHQERLLFVVQCFSVSNGVCVNLSCVAPLGLKLDRFSYHISISYGSRDKITFESQAIMKRIQEVKFETPEENFMFVPKYLCVGDDPSLKMKLVIRKLK